MGSPTSATRSRGTSPRSLSGSSDAAFDRISGARGVSFSLAHRVSTAPAGAHASAVLAAVGAGRPRSSTHREVAGRSALGTRHRRNEDAVLLSPPLVAVADGVGGAPGGGLAARCALRALGGATRGRARTPHPRRSARAELEREGIITAEQARAHPWRGRISRARPRRPQSPSVRTEAVERGDLYLLCTDGLTDVLPDEGIAGELLKGDPLVATADRLVSAVGAAERATT